MLRSFLVLVSAIVIAAGPAWADDLDELRGQRFIYHPSLLKEAGSELNREVHLRPAMESDRAYLLEIGDDEFSDRPAVAIRNVWDRIRNGFALPPLRGPLVADRELWYGQRRELVVAISQKARRYLFHIAEAVERRGLPMELALLPIVESGFEPGALSTAQASGLWQFIPGTAQRYGLKLTGQYDARRDIVASTEAALDYLEFLHGVFNDWQLALAAYNCGEEAVLRAVQRNQAKGLAADFESLSLPEETRYYLPKLMAIRNIVLSPELHGVELADIPNAPYFVGVDVPLTLDVGAVARMAGISAAEVVALNPSHNSPHISGKGKPAILLPADRADEFSQNVANFRLKSRMATKGLDRKGGLEPLVGLKPGEGEPL